MTSLALSAALASRRSRAHSRPEVRSFEGQRCRAGHGRALSLGGMTPGFRLIPDALDAAAQAALAAEVDALAATAPFRRYATPWGRTMSVEMTSWGPYGWTSSRAGYRYTDADPLTGAPWPPMPPLLLDLWRAHARSEEAPDSTLVNRYRGPAKMGLHQDLDEEARGAPVLSISLGDTAVFRVGGVAVFRVGGVARADPTSTVRLASGDLCALYGLLSPIQRETWIGNATLLQVFDITKVGKIAGCRITDGVVRRAPAPA